jgi:hypothetical protein
MIEAIEQQRDTEHQTDRNDRDHEATAPHLKVTERYEPHVLSPRAPNRQRMLTRPERATQVRAEGQRSPAPRFLTRREQAPEREDCDVSADDLHDRVRSELARGEYLSAYDVASEAEPKFPDDLWLRYAALLALARSGASERASELLDRSGLLAVTTRDAPLDLVEDIGALNARVAKDRALRATGDDRSLLARGAAERYEAVYRAFGRYYPAVNAATMYLLAGNTTRAEQLAAEVLELTADNQVEPAPDGNEYWRLASAAEAALVRGDAARAAGVLQRSAQCVPVDLAARAATRRQLRLVCKAKGIDPTLLDALAAPGVVHYCGHRIGGDPLDRFPQSEEPRVAALIARALDDANAGFGYGSLASGADIIAAEALILHGAELHVYLPFETKLFIEHSVRPGGEDWVARFHRCLAFANSTMQPAIDLVSSPEVLFDYCSRVAMGDALIRAQFLDSTPSQIAVYDEQPTTHQAGTAIDVGRWRATGHTTTVITPAIAATTSAAPDHDSTPPAADTGAPPRRIVALLFADFKDFGKLDESGLLAFRRGVMTRVATTLARYDSAILHRNTWGDGLHVVLADVVSAAHCALDLQDTIKAIDLSESSLPTSPQLRIGMHVGPVFALHDPVLDETGFLGTHITRTARIEPRTPEGSVYVTDQFAALLALEDRNTLACDYVGHIPTAKDYGILPMYVLHRRAQAS